MIFKKTTEIKTKIANYFKDSKNIFGITFRFAIQSKKYSLNLFHNWEQNYYIIFIVIFIVTSFFIRLAYTKTGLPYLHYGDEPHIAAAAIRMLQNGDFNPHDYLYPTLSMYLLLPIYILNYFRLMGNGSLNGLSEINTEEWFWSISHPSFYLIGRILMVLLIIVSIYLIFEIGKRFFNKTIGLISALILAFFDIQNTFITLNKIVMFFALLTLYLLSLYIERKKTIYIILSSISAGFTISSKYNAFLILVPILFAIIFYSRNRIKHLLIFLPISIFSFFIGTPYSLLDINNFLEGAGAQVAHYKFGKDIDASPGIEQLKFYLNFFKTWFNETFHFNKAFTIPIIGTVTSILLDIKKVLIIFSYPILYVLYMSTQKINYTRNMLCVKPFIILVSAIAIYYFYELLVIIINKLWKLKPSHSNVNRNIVFIIIILILFILIQPISIINNSYRFITTYKESRTQAIEYISNNFPHSKVGIQKELRIHKIDLDKINNKKVIDTMIPLEKLYYDNYDYIISSDDYIDVYQNEEDVTNYIALLNNFFPKENIIKTFGYSPVNLDYCSTEPKIHIYKVNDTFLNEEKILTNPIGNIIFDSLYTTNEDIIKLDEIAMITNCSFRTCYYKYNKGYYVLNISAKGTIANQKWPILELKLLSKEGDLMHIVNYSETKEITSNNYQWYSYYFNIDNNNSIISLELSFINDYYDSKKGEDRNIYINEIKINKES